LQHESQKIFADWLHSSYPLTKALRRLFMQTGAITQYVDVAQLVLYMFWIFFFGLIYYLLYGNQYAMVIR
jgi:uncharacterized protein with PQ loop repeat